MAILTKSFSQIFQEQLNKYAQKPISISKIETVIEKEEKMVAKKPVLICDYCGEFQECSKKNHTKNYIADLLIDAGIIENSQSAFMNWWIVKHSDQDPSGLLLGYSPEVVWPVHPHRVIKFVRKIL